MYSVIEDIRREFKSLPSKGKVVITNSKIVEYQLQTYAIINSKIGTRYATPVVGQTSVDQEDTITITAANSTSYVISIVSGGVSYLYTFISSASATTEEIVDGLIAAIDDDNNRMIETIKIDSSSFKAYSKVMGLEYSISSTTTEIAIANTQVAVIGDDNLRLLRTVEARMTACKIAEVLRIKNETALASSEVRQDLKDGSCNALAMGILDDIQNGTISLGDALLKTDGGGLSSGNVELCNEPFYKKGVQQW